MTRSSTGKHKTSVVVQRDVNNNNMCSQNKNKVIVQWILTIDMVYVAGCMYTL